MRNVFAARHTPVLRVMISVLLASLPLQAPASQMPQRFVPASDDTILLRVSARDDAAQQALRQDRQQLLNEPDNLPLALDVARRAIEQGRLQDDPRLFGTAEGALGFWWEMSEPPAQVRILRATIFQYRHRFAAAISDLNAVIEQEPDNAQARLTRAVIHTVQSRYQQALQDCARIARQGIQVTALACSATPASLTGSGEQAFEMLGRVPEQGIDTDTRIWALTLRAEIAERLGRDDAESHFLAAIDAADAHPDRYLANAYADWLLDQDRPREALGLLTEFADSDGSLLRTALAHRQLLEQGNDSSREPLQQARAELRARFVAERERGGAVHQREAAIFQLHLEQQPQEALWLARDNFRNQREPLDARIFLQAALAAEVPAQALPVVQWMRDNGVTDVRLEPLVASIEARVVTTADLSAEDSP
ncbi:MAG: hypothetical protein EA349_00825 [Halomonadaceae bacterium]|nr:MAG: hypothetical protein EA349_00825 [Halomonadaceae bacterium]